MYTSICWSITDGVKPRKNYFTYKTDIKTFVHGDVVLLENSLGDPIMGVFVRYLEKDQNPKNLKRINVIKKVHTNTLKAHLRKRYNEFKDFQLPNSETKRIKRIKEAAKLFKSEDEGYLYWKIMRIICFGNRINSKDGLSVDFYYKNKRVTLTWKSNAWRLTKVETLDAKIKWIRPTKSHYILVDLFKSEENPRKEL